MKHIKNFILAFIFINSITNLNAQSKAKYWLSPEGEIIENHNIRNISSAYPDNSMGFRKTNDSGFVYQYNVPKYSTFKVNYKIIKTHLEQISNKKFSDSTVFLLKFWYYDDPCSDVYSNEMTKGLISNRKSFLNPIKKSTEKQYNNLIFIHLFDKNVKLKKNIKEENEYFFNDKVNFFRENLFLYPTLCGSYCIIKPNGETLIRNGEYRIDWMAEHLNSKNWKQFFNIKSE